MKKYLICTICFLFLASMRAQQASLSDTVPSDTARDLVRMTTLHARGAFFGDSVVLRWVPDNPVDWKLANHYGYVIWRTVIDTAGGEWTSSEEVPISDTIRPLALSKWRSYIEQNRDKKYAAAAMQCIYGDPFADMPNESVFNFFMKSTRDENQYGFAVFSCDVSALAAQFAGLRYVDYDVEAGKLYLYTIRHLIPAWETDLTHASVPLQTDEIYRPEPIDLLKSEVEERVTLMWEREKSQLEYTAYVIERSSDGKNFQRLNKELYVQAYDEAKRLYNEYFTYTDSLGANYVPHYYRVAGMTSFGTMGPWSTAIQAIGRDKTPPASAYNAQAKHTPENTMLLSWIWQAPDTDLGGFNILYSNDLEYGFVRLNDEPVPANERVFVQEQVNEFANHYYIVQSFDTAGNVTETPPFKGYVIDSIPPKAPTGIKAEVDTLGVVTLSWPWGEELDLMGYKVYTANARDHEFSLITGYAVQENKYVDTIALNTFTKDIFYRLIAVDQSFNYSEMSDIVKVRRPDIIPPSAPILVDYEVNEDHIWLEWVNSGSDDLHYEELQRRVGLEGSWEVIRAIYDDATTHRDSALVPDQLYTYRMIAIDSSGLKSEIVRPLNLRSQLKRMLPLQNFQVQLVDDDEDGPQALLSWSAPNIPIGYKVVIYKSQGGKGYKVLHSTMPEETKYADTRVRADTTYQYAARIMLDDGTKSPYTEELTLEF